MPIGADHNRKKARKRTAEEKRQKKQAKAKARQDVKGRALDRHEHDPVAHDALASEKLLEDGVLRSTSATNAGGEGKRTLDHRHSIILRHQQRREKTVKREQTLMSGGRSAGGGARPPSCLGECCAALGRTAFMLLCCGCLRRRRLPRTRSHLPSHLHRTTTAKGTIRAIHSSHETAGENWSDKPIEEVNAKLARLKDDMEEAAARGNVAAAERLHKEFQAITASALAGHGALTKAETKALEVRAQAEQRAFHHKRRHRRKSITAVVSSRFVRTAQEQRRQDRALRAKVDVVSKTLRRQLAEGGSGDSVVRSVAMHVAIPELRSLRDAAIADGAFGAARYAEAAITKWTAECAEVVVPDTLRTPEAQQRWERVLKRRAVGVVKHLGDTYKRCEHKLATSAVARGEVRGTMSAAVAKLRSLQQEAELTGAPDAAGYAARLITRCTDKTGVEVVHKKGKDRWKAAVHRMMRAKQATPVTTFRGALFTHWS